MWSPTSACLQQPASHNNTKENRNTYKSSKLPAAVTVSPHTWWLIVTHIHNNDTVVLSLVTTILQRVLWGGTLQDFCGGSAKYRGHYSLHLELVSCLLRLTLQDINIEAICFSHHQVLCEMSSALMHWSSCAGRNMNALAWPEKTVTNSHSCLHR